MKMVLVFDTDDPKGMKNAYHMAMHIAQEYMDLSPPRRVELTKIQLMKAIKDFSREKLSGESVDLPTAAKFAVDVLKKYGIPELKKGD